jgi:hypothetical protein
MSTLTDTEKLYFENLLGLQSGYVLGYTDATFGELFNRHEIDIHGLQYQKYGTSKAKKLRAFWKQEPDALVGKILSEILDSYEADCDLNKKEINQSVLERARNIVSRLTGQSENVRAAQTIDDFLNSEFKTPNIQKLPIEEIVVPIIEQRLAEARTALGAGAYLSVIFLCGSVLEAVLLGAAQKQPADFNQANASAKANDGSVKRFHEWSLSQLIEVACEVGLLKPDVGQFSHGLRHFRNYIHPYEQMRSRFNPDQHTAKVCFQVLKAALASVAGERQ